MVANVSHTDSYVCILDNSLQLFDTTGSLQEPSVQSLALLQRYLNGAKQSEHAHMQTYITRIQCSTKHRNGEHNKNVR